MATPTTEQLAKINLKTLVPLTEDQVHTFSAKVIGTNFIPKYRIKITPNFLNKMARQAKEGVALLIDHPWQKWNLSKPIIPYGRTYDSRLVQEGEELALYADHYMVKGQEIDGITTDQLASGIDSGTIFDTSAGFISTKHVCNICKLSYYNSSCSHYRGQEYEGRECYVEEDDGELMENSLVFDGGYDGAGIQKNSLSRSIAKDEVKEEISLMPLELDTKSLDGDGSVFYFFSNKSGLSAFVPKQQNNKAESAEGDETSMSMTEAEQQALTKAQSDLGVSNGLLTSITAALGLTSNEGIVAKIEALALKAKDGEAYKTKVTEEACGAGVRAMGEAFNVEAMKLSLSNLPVAEIEKISLSYEAQAKVVLGGGGQHSQNANLTLPSDPTKNALDNSEKTVEEKQALAKADARKALENTGHSDLMKEVK